MQKQTIVQNVLDVLKRPDLLPQIQRRVEGAIQYAHRLDFFVRDRITQAQVVQNPDTIMRIALPTGWRQWESIVPMDTNGNRIKLSTDDANFSGYHEIDPKQVLTYQERARNNYYWVAGDVLNIKSECAPDQIYFIYYRYPDLRSDDAVTWITEMYPDFIEHRALYVMYSMIGNMELSNMNKRLADDIEEQLKDDAFQAGGAQ